MAAVVFLNRPLGDMQEITANFAAVLSLKLPADEYVPDLTVSATSNNESEKSQFLFF